MGAWGLHPTLLRFLALPKSDALEGLCPVLSQVWALQAAGRGRGSFLKPQSTQEHPPAPTLRGLRCWPEPIQFPHTRAGTRWQSGRAQGSSGSQRRELGTPLRALPLPFGLWRGRSSTASRKCEAFLGGVGGVLSSCVEICLFSLLK